jgi:hypothetical protein
VAESFQVLTLLVQIQGKDVPAVVACLDLDASVTDQTDPVAQIFGRQVMAGSSVGLGFVVATGSKTDQTVLLVLGWVQKDSLGSLAASTLSDSAGVLGRVWNLL